jgi:hypothetical protein
MQDITARNIFIVVIAVIAVLLIGDYLGYKVGRRRLATVLGVIALVTVVAFAIYAAIAL